MLTQKERNKLLSNGVKLVDYRNKNWLTNQSINLKKSPSDIAKMCNASIPTIDKWLIKFDITPSELNKPKMIPDPLELKEIASDTFHYKQKIASDTSHQHQKSNKKFKNGNNNFKKSKQVLNTNLDLKPKNESKSLTIGVSEDKKSKPKEVKLLNKEELKTEVFDTDLSLLTEPVKTKKTIKKTVTKETKSGLWEKIINSVEIPDIYPKTLSLELTNNRYYRGECALHPNTKGDSFRYFPDTKSWNCFHQPCKTGGDVINLHAHINNIDYKDAMIELAKQYKIPFDKFDKEKIDTIIKIEKMYKDYAEKCHENLKKSKYYELEKQKRRFTDDTMNFYPVGLVSKTIQKYMESKYPKDLLIKAGFINEKGYGHWICGKRIVYPYLNRNLGQKFFIHRGINSEPDFRKDKKGELIKYIKLIKTEYTDEIPFGLDSINNHLDKPFIIVEGITDAMSVKQEDYYSCISPVTIWFKDTELEALPNYCKRFEKTIIIFDNEKNGAGLKGAEKTLKVLLKNGINGHIGIIPNKYIDKSIKNWKIDVDEFLRDYSLEEFEQIINDAISGFDYFLNTINEQSSQNAIIEIFKLLPKNDIVIQGKTFRKIAKKSGLNLKEINDIFKQYQEQKLLKEKRKQGAVQEIKKSEKEDNKDIFERIELAKLYDIEIRKEGIFKIIWKKDKNDNIYPVEIPVLDGKLEVLFKTYDNILDTERFTFLLNGIQYNTYTVMNMIKKFEAKIYEGTHGRDIIKKVFNYFSDKIENKKAEYIIGFNNGWKMPYLEKEGKYAIISYTDIDRIVYKNAQKCVKEYSDKEKQKIIEKLKLFIIKTQTTPIKLLKIITWSIASIFRMPIIDFFKIFPIFYNYGERNSGKGSLEEFWIIHFYGLHKKLLPSKTLGSASRLEDYLASSTFPIVITEADGINIKKTLSVIKEHASDDTDFERKKPDQTLVMRKTKTAGLCLDSNIIIETFNDPALNSKCIMNEFTKKDVPKIDFEWKKLNRELKKEKLFSFIYNTTKDWNDKTLFKIFDNIIEETKEKIKNYEEIERINPRILLTFQVCLFGLYVWNESFEFPLEQTLNIGFNQLLDSLISGRKVIPRNLVDQFYRFCLTAINFEEDYDEEYTTKTGSFTKKVRGSNPKYLTSPLKEHKDGFHYAFTQNNLRDFNEYAKNYGKSNYGLIELTNKLEDGLNDKDDIYYKNCQAFDSIHRERVILINKEWLI